MVELHWRFCAFDELSREDLYRILAVRQQVFVVGQKILYTDADGRDPLAFHLSGLDDAGRPVAYLRVQPPGQVFDCPAIGRVLTAPGVRGRGYGHALMKRCLEYCAATFGPGDLAMAAQAHLQGFYRQHGFIAEGPVFMEEGLEHIHMRRPGKKESDPLSAGKGG